MSYYAIKKYTADGATVAFAFTFPYLDAAHIEVRLAGVLQTSGYTLVGSTVTFAVAPLVSVLVDIRRNTSRSAALVTYTDAANLPASVINKATLQALYTAEEACDIAAEAIPLDVDDKYNAGSHVIKNVGIPVNSTDAASKDYVDTTLLGVTPGTALPIASGGTSSTTQAGARTALDVYSKGESDAITNALWTTGDVKVTLKTVADAGWIMFDDGTIGDSASGATTRANADTQALFELLWNNTTDANCPVSTGRGADAATDFAAHKTISLPLALGRALAVAGAGGSLTARALGEALGAEDAIVPAHTHTVSDPGHAHSVTYPNYYNGGNAAGINSASGTGGTPIGASVSASGTGVTVNSTGTSVTDANVQPTTFLKIMAKL